MFYIFDLDHTVIDSTHRQLTDGAGNLCLKHWRENCTLEKIMQDSLLPLAQVMRDYHARGDIIIICTARIVTEHDIAFLDYHNLPWNVLISREPDDARADGVYKLARLKELAETYGFASLRDMGAIMFDDNKHVIAVMMANGVYCFDAIKYNRRIAR
jgi:hypothetical protein